MRQPDAYVRSSETRQNIARGQRRHWAGLSDERRRELAAAAELARRRAEQLSRIKHGTLLSVDAVPCFVDEDFDDL